jgi:hypothetical protein
LQVGTLLTSGARVFVFFVQHTALVQFLFFAKHLYPELLSDDYLFISGVLHSIAPPPKKTLSQHRVAL